MRDLGFDQQVRVRVRHRDRPVVQPRRRCAVAPIDAAVSGRLRTMVSNFTRQRASAADRFFVGLRLCHGACGRERRTQRHTAQIARRVTMCTSPPPRPRARVVDGPPLVRAACRERHSG